MKEIIKNKKSSILNLNIFYKRIFTSFMIIFIFLYGINCQTKKDTSLDDLAKLLILNSLLNPTCKYGTVSDGTDPLFSSQWHLSQASGYDAGVITPWNDGILGEGVTVAVVDDGMETGHEDLCGNISAVKSYNYLKNSLDPGHYYLDSGHGTSVAGIIAAQSNNNVGLRGASPKAKLTARNILELTTIGSSVIADAMTRDIASIYISNNSWGASDGTGLYSDEFASSLWQSAIESGITSGRNGLGTIYTWAAGNGATNSINQIVDNSNYDGQANFHGVLSICGVGSDDKKAFYSENGANLWVCSHTMGDDFLGISTTDRSGESGGNNSTRTTNFSNRSYRNDFNGTSSSAPLAAGVIALLMSKYPDLSWRDVREILAFSARKNDSSDTDWTTNGANLNINHKYGFGTIHANDAIQKASTWSKITNPYLSIDSDTISNQSITSGGTTTTTITSTSNQITKIEFIDVYFTTSFTQMGKIKITLTHSSIPANSNGLTSTESILMEPHSCYTSSGNTISNCSSFSSSSSAIRFGTARHLQESTTGSWTLTVVNSGTATGTYSVKLKFRGRVN
jgi:proprotein convertase subtilisin/kexin type 2